VATITGWLASLGLPEYPQRFAENGIDLRYLTDQDLEKIGVLLGHRRKMLAAIAALSGAAPVMPQFAKPPEPNPRDDGERRQLTVMFTDQPAPSPSGVHITIKDCEERKFKSLRYRQRVYHVSLCVCGHNVNALRMLFTQLEVLAQDRPIFVPFNKHDILSKEHFVYLRLKKFANSQTRQTVSSGSLGFHRLSEQRPRYTSFRSVLMISIGQRLSRSGFDSSPCWKRPPILWRWSVKTVSGHRSRIARGRTMLRND
jgi:hypothetical protein